MRQGFIHLCLLLDMLSKAELYRKMLKNTYMFLMQQYFNLPKFRAIEYISLSSEPHPSDWLTQHTLQT